MKETEKNANRPERSLLPKNFFRDNKPMEMTTPQITLFSVNMVKNDLVDNTLKEDLWQELPPERRDTVEKEKEKISLLQSAEEVVRFMRSGCDKINDSLFCQRALAMQEEVIPLMLKRFCTSLQDRYIELSTLILANAEISCMEQLKAIYPDIKNPYAQSDACLLFGIRKQTDTLPLLLREYERMKKNYPYESFSEGPLLGIYLLFDKI